MIKSSKKEKGTNSEREESERERRAREERERERTCMGAEGSSSTRPARITFELVPAMR
jgi:hypothetical protein